MARSNALSGLRQHEALLRSELRTIGDANEVGRMVVEQHYGGIAAFQSGSGTSGSLRDLSDQLEGRLSPATLWRAASTYVLLLRAPDILNAKHLRLSHVYAVLELPHAFQIELLQRAERERWTAEALREASPRLPSKRRSGMRATQLAALHAALSRLADLPLPGRSKVSAEAASTLLILVDTARDRLDVIRAWISSVPLDE